MEGEASGAVGRGSLTRCIICWLGTAHAAAQVHHQEATATATATGLASLRVPFLHHCPSPLLVLSNNLVSA